MDVTTLTQFLSMTTFQPAYIGVDAITSNNIDKTNRSFMNFDFTMMTLLFDDG